MAHERKLKVERIMIERLEYRWIEEMWALYTKHYDNVDRAVFDRDLSEKQVVFLAFDARTGAVGGFSTAVMSTHRYGGRRIGVYFSGDTMVDPRYWGQRALHRAVVGTLLTWRLRHPFRRLYWHLVCNGYRTFLSLANNFPEYWPHAERELPEWERGLIDQITGQRFGSKWCPDRGVVTDTVRLKAHVASFTPEVRALPAVQFFVGANPGYARGDELSMIGRVNARFFFRITAKLLRITARRTSAAPERAVGVSRVLGRGSPTAGQPHRT